EVFGAALLVAVPVPPEAIVLLALALVGQHLVRLVDLFELGLGLFVAGVDIWVILAGQLSICLLYLSLTHAPLDAQRLIIVLIVHSCSSIVMRCAVKMPQVA